MPKSIKNILFYTFVILVIIYGYKLLTGKSIATLPGEIAHKIQQIGSTTQTESTNPHYYKDPDKNLPEDMKKK